MSPSIDNLYDADPPEAPEESSSAHQESLARLKTEFLALKAGFKEKSYAGTPIYDELRREYIEEEQFDARIQNLSVQRLHYGTFI